MVTNAPLLRARCSWVRCGQLGKTRFYFTLVLGSSPGEACTDLRYGEQMLVIAINRLRNERAGGTWEREPVCHNDKLLLAARAAARKQVGGHLHSPCPGRLDRIVRVELPITHTLHTRAHTHTRTHTACSKAVIAPIGRGGTRAHRPMAAGRISLILWAVRFLFIETYPLCHVCWQALCRQMAHITCDGIGWQSRVQAAGYRYTRLSEIVSIAPREYCPGSGGSVDMMECAEKVVSRV